MRSNLGIKIRDYRWFAFTSFAFLFRKKTYVKEKSSWSKISSRLLAYTHTCVLCTHIRIHICQDLVHLDSLGPPGVSSRPLGSHQSTPSVQCVCVCASHPDPWAHIRVPHLCSVCACVRIHTHTPTYTPTRVKKREDQQHM